MNGYRSHILKLRIDVGWYRYTQLLQHVFQALNRKRRLGGLVSGPG